MTSWQPSRVGSFSGKNLTRERLELEGWARSMGDRLGAMQGVGGRLLVR